MKSILLIILNVTHEIKWLILKNVFGKRRIWTFDNGIKISEDRLQGWQINRYKKINFHEPEEEKLFTEIIKSYKGKGVFLDIGAAAGYYSFLSRKLNPGIEIHAFNPSAQFWEIMEETAQLNDMSDITQHEEAITNYIGTCSLEQSKWGSRIGKDGEIPTMTLTEFIGQLNKDVFLAKMDIQGEEVNALDGAKQVLGKIENWIIGTHGLEVHKKCAEILENAGYSIVRDAPQVENQPDGIIVAKRK